MNKLLALLFLGLSFVAQAKERVTGWCENGAQTVAIGSLTSTSLVQASYPNCTVTVYNTGTLNLATIYTNNSGSPQANPFTASNTGLWYFYATNGVYDVQLSGSGMSTYTIGAISLFDVGDYGILAAGNDTDVQYNCSGSFCGSSTLTFNYNTGLFSTPTIALAGTSYNTISSPSGGINVPGYDVSQNVGITQGGYIHLTPITYNPYDSPTQCLDVYGNVVQQPVPITGATFGANDVVMWLGTSPSMPADSSCGTPLPINLIYGLNINTYFFARGGLSTDQPYYNSIQSLMGGLLGQSIIAGRLYPAGTVTTTGTLAQAAYLGGYIQVGHSNGPPAAGTIATVTNPLTIYDTVEQGTLYFDDALGCFNGNFGTSGWKCLGSSGGGSPGGPTNAVQINGGSGFSGSSAFTYNPTTNVLAIVGTTTSGADAPVFSSSNTGHTFAYTDVGGNFGIYGDGTAGFQTVNSTTGFFIGAYPTTTYGLNSSGYLTVSGCTGCGSGGGGSPVGPAGAIQFTTGSAFNGDTYLLWNDSTKVMTISGATTGGLITPVVSTSNTGHTNAYVTPSSTIYADGTAGFQTLYAASGSTSTGFFIGTCTPSCTSAGYGLDGNGNLTVATATISGLTGYTQCLEVNTSGLVQGTGTACGTGGGAGVTQLNPGALTGAVTLAGAGGITVSQAGSIITFTGSSTSGVTSLSPGTLTGAVTLAVASPMTIANSGSTITITLPASTTCSSVLTDCMTIDTSQNVTGTKTWTVAQVFSNNVALGWKTGGGTTIPLLYMDPSGNTIIGTTSAVGGGGGALYQYINGTWAALLDTSGNYYPYANFNQNLGVAGHSWNDVFTGLLYLGQASHVTGIIQFYNSSTTGAVTIESGATTSSYTLYTPTAGPAYSTNNCLGTINSSSSTQLTWIPCVTSSTGGITSINSQSGPSITVASGTGVSVSTTTNTLTITNTGVTSLGGSTGALNLSAGTGVSISGLAISIGQSVATSANVSFQSVTSAQEFLSNASVGYAFATGNGDVTITATGVASFNGSVSASSLVVGGNTIVNTSGFISSPTGQNIQTGDVFAVTGGYYGITHTVTIGSCNMYFEGGILYNTSGC